MRNVSSLIDRSRCPELGVLSTQFVWRRSNPSPVLVHQQWGYSADIWAGDTEFKKTVAAFSRVSVLVWGAPASQMPV